jgi:hypothetical protein
MALFVALAGAHGAALLAAPSLPLVAIGLWWNANTIAHNFIHRPFFRSRLGNRAFSLYLSLVLGVPQSYWRLRHLRHHAELDGMAGARAAVPVRRTVIATEAAAVAALWATIAIAAPAFFLGVYAPGYLLGLGLCFLQGYYEHTGGTTSHYGRLYNALFFNDGYHAEHHRRPGASWQALRNDRRPGTRASRWPPVLRWLEAFSPQKPHRWLPLLDGLERLVLRSPALQRFVVDRHERAFRKLLPALGSVRHVTIVGGGLFPRTAIVLRRLLPDASLSIVEADAGHLALAHRLLDEDERVQRVHGSFDASAPSGADLVVVPLAYRGDRRRLYEAPPARRVIVHDWIWSPRPDTAIVSWLLLKRLNLIPEATPRRLVLRQHKRASV